MSKQPYTTRTREALTRAKAERELAHGANPTLEKYTKHPNKHVRDKAAKLAGKWS